MIRWPDVIGRVITECRGARDYTELLARASAIVGRPVTINALEKALRRGGGPTPTQLLEAPSLFPSCDTETHNLPQDEWDEDTIPEFVPWSPAPGPVRDHLVIGDTQVRDGVPLDHIRWCGRLIEHRKPGAIVMIGDWYDMPAAGVYEPGIFADDYRAGTEALDVLMSHIRAADYDPLLVFCEGNHEERVDRFIRSNPALAGMLPYPRDLFAARGWHVFPFQEICELDGIRYSHLFAAGPNGNTTKSGARNGQPSALQQARRVMRSATAGHKQGLDFHIQQSPAGSVHSIIAGSFYLHPEPYLGKQGQNHWRGLVYKNRVRDGEYSPEFLSMDYLKHWYGQ